MRLIDANALIMAFERIPKVMNAKNKYHILIRLPDMFKAIKHQPTIDPQPMQWIPCSEELPKKSGKYYVSGGGKAWICEYLIIPNFIGGWCNDASNPVVQAWMPLPRPYEGGQE